MPVTVRRKSGTFKGKKFKFVTQESSGKIKSRHTNKTDADASARIRNSKIAKKGKKK